MKTLALSILCAGLISTTAIAEDICDGAYQAQNYQQSAACYVQQLKKERTFRNLEITGISYMKLGRYKEALPYLKEAETKAGTGHEYQILCSYLGSLYDDLGDPARSFPYKMKYLDLSLKSGDKEDIGKAYNNLAGYYIYQKQPKKALEYYEKSLEYQEELERAATYNNMSLAYYNLQDFTKSEEMLQNAIVVNEKVGAYQLLGHSKLNLCIFYFQQNRAKETPIILQEVLVIGQNTNDISMQSQALSYLAAVDYWDGKIDQAKIKASEALRLAKQSGASGTIGDANDAWNLVNGKQ